MTTTTTLPPHRIVVGVDGSASAWRALDWAADEALRTQRTLLVAHVGPEQVEEHDFTTQLLADAVDRATEDRPHLLVHTVRLPGDPAQRLEELAADADLLVVGRGHHGVEEVLLGSVGRRVVGHTTCPTVVVPDGNPAPRHWFAREESERVATA